MALHKQLLNFIAVGSGAAGVHFCVLWGLVNIMSLTPALANFIAFLTAFIASFTGHLYITFQRDQTSLSLAWKASLIKWLITSIAGFALNQTLFVTGINLFGEHHYLIIWLVATVCVTAVTFILGKVWAFRQ